MDDAGEWTKVEKRKSKKQKKMETKLEVRPPVAAAAPCVLTSVLPPPQANPPKFMYAKNEIMRRREAVGIDVRYVLSSSNE